MWNLLYWRVLKYVCALNTTPKVPATFPLSLSLFFLPNHGDTWLPRSMDRCLCRCSPGSHFLSPSWLSSHLPWHHLAPIPLLSTQNSLQPFNSLKMFFVWSTLGICSGIRLSEVNWWPRVSLLPGCARAGRVHYTGLSLLPASTMCTHQHVRVNQ